MPRQTLLEPTPPGARPPPRSMAAAATNSGLLARLGLAFCLVGCTLACGGPKPPPNLILITLDTLRSDRLGSYGYRRPTSPVLDSLARRGVRFEDAIAQSTTTPPSHASIMTGLNPTRHGLRRLHGQRLPESNTTLAEILRDAGYSTAAFLSALPLTHAAGIDQGFDVYEDRLDGEASARSASDTNVRVFAWLEGLPDPPVFLWVHYFDTHYPYFPPVEYQRRFGVRRALRDYLPAAENENPETTGLEKPRKRNPNGVTKMSNLYDGELAYMDAALGQLLATLEDAGMLEDAAIAIVADHGELLGEYGYYYGHWGVLEEVVGVPMILVHPQGRYAGRSIPNTVATIDLVPTLLSWLSVESALDFDGIDLNGLMEGGSAPERSIYSEQFEFFPVRSVRNGGFMLRQRAARKKHISTATRVLYERRPHGQSAVPAPAQSETEALLSQQMDAVVAAADRHETQRQAVTPEMRERLRALGYTGEARGPD
jgi:arylsulfatase A-like enzyme